MEEQSKSKVSWLMVMRNIVGIALIILFAFYGAWLPLGDSIDNVFIFIFYFVTGAIVAAFTRKWWPSGFIALPNSIFALVSFEPIYLLAFLLLPLSGAILGSMVIIFLIDKALAWLSSH